MVGKPCRNRAAHGKTPGPAPRRRRVVRRERADRQPEPNVNPFPSAADAVVGGIRRRPATDVAGAPVAPQPRDRAASPRGASARDTEARRGRPGGGGRCETVPDGEGRERELRRNAAGSPRPSRTPYGALPIHQAPDSRTASRTGSCGTRQVFGCDAATVGRGPHSAPGASQQVWCPGGRGPRLFRCNAPAPRAGRVWVMTGCIMRSATARRQPIIPGSEKSPPPVYPGASGGDVTPPAAVSSCPAAAFYRNSRVTMGFIGDAVNAIRLKKRAFSP